MLTASLRSLRAALTAFVASQTPAQVATGFTLGMIIGFVPKANLIAISLFVLLFSIRCNRGIAILSAVVFTFVSAWTDPIAHKLGLAVLSAPLLQAHFASVYNLPLGPWLGFHNTVVCGSLLLAAYAAYPVHWLAKTCFAIIPWGCAQ